MLTTATTSAVILAQFVFCEPIFVSEKAVLCLFAVAGIAVAFAALWLTIKSKR